MKNSLIIDNFAGGGGASTGIEAALGRAIDIAINHDPEAVAMHAANHPDTLHYCQSVWRADPLEVTGGRHVRLAWFSPDCKHFSKAKGGKPVEKHIRDLAWVVVLWAQRVKPDVIMLENVEEFRTWGPIAEDGRPCPESKGLEFARWIKELKKAGYKVDLRELHACDYGAPTSRKRLFIIARRDGQPIIWPKPTHGSALEARLYRQRNPGRRVGRIAANLIPYRTAADCIDWSIPCPSIFERTRPLKEATCRRIAHGIMKFVVNADRPFIIPICHTKAKPNAHSADEPLRTITTAKGGEMALVVPTLVTIGYGEREGQAPRVPGIEKPLGAVVAGGGKHALVTAFLAQHNTMPRGGVHPGKSPEVPLSTVTARGTQTQLVTSNLIKLRNNCTSKSVEEPIDTISAGGGHFAEIRAFLIKYYGNEDGGHGLSAPLGTVTSRDRFGLVTVSIDGEEYAIADIGMRMLSARELARAQGFPDSYILDPIGPNGKPLTKTAQIRMIGNSVCPPLSEALVRANLPEAQIDKEAA